MERACDVCGEMYEALRSTSRACSKRCRVRKSRARTAAPGVSLPVAAAGEVAEDDVDSLLASTRAELEAAGRAGTPLGRAALLTAARLDRAAREPGMGFASLLKEFRASRSAALEGAARAADPVDELKAARDRKRAG